MTDKIKACAKTSSARAASLIFAAVIATAYYQSADATTFNAAQYVESLSSTDITNLFAIGDNWPNGKELLSLTEGASAPSLDAAALYQSMIDLGPMNDPGPANFDVATGGASGVGAKLV